MPKEVNSKRELRQEKASVCAKYKDGKALYPDSLLLFRAGDFYELFFDDAERAAKILQLVVTTRIEGDLRIPMTGFPWHALESHLRSLISAKCKVAVMGEDN